MQFQKLISFFLSVILFFYFGVTLGTTDLKTAGSLASFSYARDAYRGLLSKGGAASTFLNAACYDAALRG